MSIGTVQSYVTSFRETMDEGMQSLISSKEAADSFLVSGFNSDIDTERGFIESLVANLKAESNTIKTTKVNINTNPLTSFKDKATAAKIDQYTPIYTDLTNASTKDITEIVSHALSILNLNPDTSAIDDLLKTRAYQSGLLNKLSDIFNACINFRSNIGTPATLYRAIVDYEFETRYSALLEELEAIDAQQAAKGFNKPTSLSVTARAKQVDKFNRDRLAKYGEAIKVFNDRMAALFAEAFSSYLSLLDSENKFTSSMVGLFAEAATLQLDLDYKLKEVEFTKYKVSAQKDITGLQQKLNVTKNTENAFREFAIDLFNLDLKRLMSLFDVEKKKAVGELLLAVSSNKTSVEEFKANLSLKIEEIKFLKQRLVDVAEAMGNQVDDKLKYTAEAQKSYQAALKTLGTSAIALNTEK
jgi:hypothetical protein